MGVKNSGHQYLPRWLEENQVHPSSNASMILEACAFYGQFVTYDMLFEYLKDHNWGELRVDMNTEEVQTKTEEKLHEQRIVDLGIKKALALKRERLQKLELLAKSKLAQPQPPNKEMLLNIVRDRAISDFSVSRKTAQDYSRIVVYGIVASTQKKITPEERKQIDKKDDWQREYASLLKTKENLKQQYDTLVHAERNWPGRFKTQLEEIEVKLAQIEDEIICFGRG